MKRIDIDPSTVAAELENIGWRRVPTKGHGLVVYIDPAAPPSQRIPVSIPTDPTLKDYELRMSQAIRALSTIVGVSIGGQFRPVAPQARIVLMDDTFASGVPVEAASRFLDAVSHFVLALACTVIDPRPNYPSRKPAGAHEIAATARVLAVEPGGVSITMEVAEPLPIRQQSDRDLLHQWGLAITTFGTLVTSPLPLTTVASEEALVDAGVSVNSCAAILRMGGDARHPIELTIARPNGVSDSPRAVVSTEAFAAIEAIEHHLRHLEPIEEAALAGPILRLERIARRGFITIRAEEGTVSHRLVRTALRAGDYQKAIRAHASETPIRLRGTLIRTGRLYELVGATVS